MKDLISAASLLIAALGLLAQNAFPPWMIVVVAVCLIAIAAGLLYTRSARLSSRIVTKWRLRRLARTGFPELLESATKLQQLIAENNTNTLLYVLSLARQRDETRGKSLLPDAGHIETIRNWLSAVEKRAKRHRLGEFSTLCEELSHLIHMYNYFFCQRLRQLEEFIRTVGLNEDGIRQLKQHWNVAREAHVALIRKWEVIPKKINEITGGRLCIDYYEPLGTLE